MHVTVSACVHVDLFILGAKMRFKGPNVWVRLYVCFHMLVIAPIYAILCWRKLIFHVSPLFLVRRPPALHLPPAQTQIKQLFSLNAKSVIPLCHEKNCIHMQYWGVQRTGLLGSHACLVRIAHKCISQRATLLTKSSRDSCLWRPETICWYLDTKLSRFARCERVSLENVCMGAFVFPWVGVSSWWRKRFGSTCVVFT